MDQPQAIQQPEGATTYPAFDLSVLEAHSPAEEHPEIMLDLLKEEGTNAPLVRPTTVATDRTEAAKVALIQGGGPKELIDTYNRVYAEMQDRSGFSQTMEEVRANQRANTDKMLDISAANALIDGEFVNIPGGEQNVAAILGATKQAAVEEDLDTTMSIKAASRNPDTNPSVGLQAIMDGVTAKQNAQLAANRVMMEMGSEVDINSNVAVAAKMSSGTAQAVLPFVESEQTRRILQEFEKASGLNVANQATSFILTGEVKHAIREGLDNLYKQDPQRAESVAKEMLSHLRDNTNVLYKNDFSSYMRLNEIFGLDGFEYTTLYRVLDNLGGAVDFVYGAGGIFRTTKNVIKNFKATPKFTSSAAEARWFRKEGEAENVLEGDYIPYVATRDVTLYGRNRLEWEADEAVKHTAIDSTAPTSPARLLENVNPVEARALTQVALNGTTDDAVAIYGTANKVDIEVRVNAPTIPDGIGSIENKVKIRPDQDISEFIKSMDSLNKSDEERAAIVEQVAASFRQAEGIQVRQNMTTVRTNNGDLLEVGGGVKSSPKGDYVHTQVAYTLKDKGFKTGNDAYDYAQFALRDRGVQRGEMQLYQKLADRWVPVNGEAVIKKETIPDDLLKYNESVRVKKNLLDRDTISKTDNVVYRGDRGYRFIGKAGYDDLLKSKTVRARQGSKQDYEIPYFMSGKSSGRYANNGGDEFLLEAIPDKSWRSAAGDSSYKGPTNPLSINDKIRVYKKNPDGSYSVVLDNIKDTALLPKGGEEYLLTVKHEEKMNVTDLEAMSDIQVGHNWIDRYFAGYNGPTLSDVRVGSGNSFLFSPLVALKSLFTSRAALVATSKTSALEEILLRTAEQLSNEIKVLGKEQHTKMVEFVLKANREGIKFDPSWARVNAWSDDTIQAMTTFRKLQDQLFYLENFDKVRSERARSGRLWLNKATGESALVRPIPRNQVNKRFDGSRIDVYDSTSGTIIRMTHDEVAELYKKGGELLDARRPIHHTDGIITVIKSENGAGASYHRALRDNDQVLSYKEGYYSRQYTGHYFVRQAVRDKSGEVLYYKAVGNAGSKKEGDTLLKQFQDKEPDNTFVLGEDAKGSSAFEDATHDLHQQGGRSAQRIRGEQLKSGLTQEDLELAETADPMEIVVGAIKSISRRTAMRDWFDTTKARMMNRYGEEELPRNEMTGLPEYPASAGAIHYRGPGIANRKRVADARTLFNYVRQLEDGYASFIDDFWKGGLNAIANTFTWWSGAEKGIRNYAKTAKGPVAASRMYSSTMVLFTDMIRQVVIQPAQAIQLMAITHPMWSVQGTPQAMFVTMRMAGVDVTDKMLRKYAGWTRADFNNVYEGFTRSGQWAEVDKNNMVRGVLGDMADRKLRGGDISSTIKKYTIDLTRKYGIDAGERLNSTLHFLAFADNARRAGKDLSDVRVIDEVASEAKTFSGSMNEAGDMPQNHGAFGLVFQFAQIGHKMLENMTTSVQLNAKQKAKLIGLNLLMFGLPINHFYEKHVAPKLPEDPKLREAARQGVINWAANKAISMGTDSETRVNISGSITPFSLGFGGMMYNLIAFDPMTTLAKTPTGSLIAGNNPKVTKFVNELTNWFVPKENMDASTLSSTLISFGDMFNGFSRPFKAALILSGEKSLSAKGATADFKADYVASMAALFGFRTEDEDHQTLLRESIMVNSKSMKDDVKKLYDQWALQLRSHGKESADYDSIQRCYALGFELAGGSPAFWNEWEKQCKRNIISSEAALLEDIYNSHFTGESTLEEVIEMLRILPEEQKTPETDGILKDFIDMRDEKGAFADGE